MKRLLLLACLLVAAAGHAQTRGAIFGDHSYCHSPIDVHLSFIPSLALVGGNPPLQRSFKDPYITAIAPASRGRVLAISLDAELFEVRADGTFELLPESVAMPSVPGNHANPVALTEDAQGNIFAFGGWPTKIYVFNKRGALLRKIDVFFYNLEFPSIDLAADQCTLYVAGGDRLRRVDVCSGAVLPPILQGERVVTVRVLPGGNLLIGSFPLREYDPAGTLVRTYPGTNVADAVAPGEYVEANRASLALLDGGRRAWYSVGSIGDWPCTSRIIEVDLQSGATTVAATVDMDEPLSLAPPNAWWAAAGPSVVPTVSQWSMLVMAGLLVVIALLRTMS